MYKYRGRILLLLFVMGLILAVGNTGLSTASTLGSRTLSIGSAGNDVVDLQKFLNLYSYFVGAVDGIFGNMTKNGVINFQKDHTLVPDGIVGKQTFAAINQARAPGDTNLYPVQPGDSLFWIAIRYGTSVAELKNTNSLHSDSIFAGQYLLLPGVPAAFPWSELAQAEQTKPVSTVMQEKGIAQVSNPLIVVDKSDHTLSFFSGSTLLRSFRSSTGDGGSGDKAVSGDHKTPVGRFYVSEVSVLNPPDPYLGSRWLRISYPNVEDALRGLQQGLIDTAAYQAIVEADSKMAISPQRTSLGGGIGLHGGTVLEFAEDWTWGCIGLTNLDVEELFNYVGTGTPVVIIP